MPVILRSRWQTRLALALTLALLFALSSAVFIQDRIKLAHAAGVHAHAGGGLTQLSSDPYTNQSSQHQTEVEPDSFSHGSTIVAATQAGRFFSSGSSNVGWATSMDDGQTWSHGFLPGTTVYATPKGIYASVSDPSVAYDTAHKTWLISSLAIATNGSSPTVLVNRSTNGGTTWSKPVSVIKPRNASLDKDWIVCDGTASSKFYGHCYIEWEKPLNGFLIQMSTSTDGGKTWGAAKATANKASGLGGQPLVQPNGTVIVPFLGPGVAISAFISTNGGGSWSKSVKVAAVSDRLESGNLRSSPLPSAEMDSAGKVFVVWQDCRFESSCNANDIVMSTSTDGKTWSAVQRIPIDAVGSGVDHFIPGIAVDQSTSGSTAHLGLAYYFYPLANCMIATCQLTVGFVSSTDGGSSWTSGMAITASMNVTWLAATSQGYMVGDYISTSISQGKAFPLFEVATAPNGSVFNEALFTATSGLDVIAGTNTSQADRVLSAAHDLTSSGQFRYR